MLSSGGASTPTPRHSLSLFLSLPPSLSHPSYQHTSTNTPNPDFENYPNLWAEGLQTEREGGRERGRERLEV